MSVFVLQSYCKPLKFSMLLVAALAVTVAISTLGSGCKRDTAFDYHLDTGLARLRGGEFEAAIVHLKKAAQRNQTSASAYCNLGIAYWKHGDIQRAIETLTMSHDLDSSDSRPLELLAYVYMDANRFDDAREFLERANNLLPNRPRILTHLALLEFEVGQAPKVKEYLDKALQLDATYGPALYNMAVYALIEAKDKPTAQSYFARYVTSNRNGSRTGDALEQLRLLREPVVVNPPPPVNRGPEGSTPAPVPARPKPAPVAESPKPAPAAERPKPAPVVESPAPAPAGVAVENGGTNQAITADLAAATRDGDPVPPTPVKVSPSSSPAPAADSAQAHWKKAMTAHAYKDWEGAVRHYEETIKLDPKLRKVAYNLGLAYKEMGKIEEACRAFETEIKLDPSMVKAHYMAAVTLHELKDSSRAIKAAQSTLRLQPQYDKAHFLLGLLYWENGDFVASRKHFEDAVKYAEDASSRDRANAWLKNLDQ